MKTTCVIALLLLAATVALAGEVAGAAAGPPQPVKPPRPPAWHMPVFWHDMPVYVPASKAFEAARRYFSQNEQRGEAIAKLEAARQQEAAKALKAMLDDLERKYVELIGKEMTPEDKARYDKVMQAELARDEQVSAVWAEFEAVVDNVRQEQGRGEEPRPFRHSLAAKDQIIDLCLALDDRQRKEINELRQHRETEWNTMAQAITQPKDWNDQAAVKEYQARFQELRRMIESETFDGMLLVLTGPQQKACQVVTEAMEARDRRLKQITEECDAKIAQTVGKEKMGAARKAMGWNANGAVQVFAPLRVNIQ